MAVARRLAKLAGTGQSGELRIGSVPSALNAFVPPLIRRLSETAPDLIVHVEEEGSTGQVLQVSKGNLDLAIVRGRENDSGDVTFELLYNEPLCAFLARDHPLAKEGALNRRMLWNQPLIMWARNGGYILYDEILGLAEGPDGRSQIIEAPNTTSERAFAAAGLGIVVRPWFWPTHDENIVRIPILDAPYSELYMAYRNPLDSPATRSLVRLAREEALKIRDVRWPAGPN
jgi:DNA-binding transcriptional LysR family regulator